jgi:hypothetical protein
MGNVVNDFLLFSCMALFVTGIVLAAASLLIVQPLCLATLLGQ